MNPLRERLELCQGFQWDSGNADKNWLAHQVSRTECEQLFFNRPLVTRFDATHSQRESRYFALGQTDTGRRLFVVFTLRDELIRIISARDMNRKERKVYDHAEEEG
jgi:uncharacterized protein